MCNKKMVQADYIACSQYNRWPICLTKLPNSKNCDLMNIGEFGEIWLFQNLCNSKVPTL